MNIREELCEYYCSDALLFMDGYDSCICGVADRVGIPLVVCYNKRLVIEKNMTQGMTEEEAIEYFEYNQIGAYVGEHSPIFIDSLNDMDF